jgi:hypothetical protein
MDAALTPEAIVRRGVYEVTLRRGSPPTLAELGGIAGAAPDALRAALASLAAARVFVLQPSSGEILMAPPFSAVPTSFAVRTRLHHSYANCAWDALGVSVMLRERSEILSACGCCGEAMSIRTRTDGAPLGDGVIHFAVPARRWWEDIVFT